MCAYKESHIKENHSPLLPCTSRMEYSCVKGSKVLCIISLIQTLFNNFCFEYEIQYKYSARHHNVKYLYNIGEYWAVSLHLYGFFEHTSYQLFD